LPQNPSLTQKFKEHAPIIHSSAKSALIELQNPSSLALLYDNAEMVDNTLKLITFGIAINQAQRRQAQYAHFNVTISSRISILITRNSQISLPLNGLTQLTDRF
jgi:Armadillo-like